MLWLKVCLMGHAIQMRYEETIKVLEERFEQKQKWVLPDGVSNPQEEEDIRLGRFL